MEDDLYFILRPRSVAIVGASRDESKRGYQAIRTLQEGGFPGAIYPVHPRETEILGLKTYPSVVAIEGPVDLALIVTPAPTVPAILEECARNGVKGAVIIAAGFGESGPEGLALERQMVQVARTHGIRLIGPNTSGLLNLPHRLNLVGLRGVRPGRMALLCQSGNMALSLFTEAATKSRLGFSCYVGVGNEADIRYHEYLRYFREDPDTDLILMYVEGFKDGRAFLREASETIRRKPIVMLKAGRSEAGRRSIGSHTGAMAGSAVVAEAAFRQAGIVSVRRLDELLPAAEALAMLPPMRQKRAVVLADGGGHATVAADALAAHGFEIPELDAETQRLLGKILPDRAAVRNPVDVAGATDSDPALFAECAHLCLADPNVDGMLMVGLFGGYGIRFAEKLGPIESATARRLGTLVNETGKPMVVQSCYAGFQSEALEILRQSGVPVYESLEISAACLRALGDYGHHLQRAEERTDFALPPNVLLPPEVREALSAGRSNLLEHEARHLLRDYQLPVAEFVLASDPEAAVFAAREFNSPVAMKIVSPDILHKTEAGGVRLNVAGETEVRKAFAEILENASRYKAGADLRGVLVSPMMPKGLEVIVGVTHDEQFGPVIMFGLGGIMVDVLKDVAFRVLPLTERDARDMLAEIKATPILDGVRGAPPADREALARLLLRVSDLVLECPQIRELDLNPVFVYPEGVSVVDARILLHGPEGLSSHLAARP